MSDLQKKIKSYFMSKDEGLTNEDFKEYTPLDFIESMNDKEWEELQNYKEPLSINDYKLSA